MHQSVRLQVVIPFWQPVSASDGELEKACVRCYEPLLEAVRARPKMRFAAYFGGHLLDYVSRHRPTFLDTIRELVGSGQLEVLGGLFYGGIPALLAEHDLRAQIEMSAGFWDSYLGETPSGYWLPELCWAAEVPRLVADSGLEYGFVGADQLHESSVIRSLGVLNRGGSVTTVFCLDTDLSRALPIETVESWINNAVACGQTTADGLLAVWVRAESLGLEPGTFARCHNDGWLARWLDALCDDANDLRPTLPRHLINETRRGAPLTLNSGFSATAGLYGAPVHSGDWGAFVRLYPEVENLYHRMQRLSARLQEMLTAMEEEEQQDQWGDALATTQRLLFGAQSHDAYWRGTAAGFGDPRIREATLRRILQAENIVDQLLQGDDDWIADEEEDRDGDLVAETFVSTALLSAWLSTHNGFTVRAIDDRKKMHTLLDVGHRRNEPFFDDIATAPTLAAALESGFVGRNAPVPVDSDALPLLFDREPRLGITTRVVDAAATAESFFAGDAPSLLPAGESEWQVLNKAIDDEGDFAYHFAVRAALPLRGAQPRTLTLDKTLRLPIDAAELYLSSSAALGQGAGGQLLLCTELPLRLASAKFELWINGEAANHTTQAQQVSRVELRGSDGDAVAIDFEQPITLWTQKLESTLRGLGGYRVVPQGIVLLAMLPIPPEGERVDLGLTLRL